MKILYINCSNGVSGDMLLSSLINSGIDPKGLENTLKKNLELSGWKLEIHRNRAVHFPVTTLNVAGNITFSSPAQMKSIIRKSSFSADIRKKGIAILDTLIDAESAVHKVPLKGVHFHELNSIDTLVDVMGACVCVDLLKADKVMASPVNLGSPMPATIEIARSRKIPVFSSDPSFEMATPTGAAIIANIADEFGEMPLMKFEKTGFGSGTKRSSKGYSILKVYLGEAGGAGVYQSDETVLLETNIDDMDPRIYPYVMEKLFEAGAKDVWFNQVLMKKGRPGIVLSALSARGEENKLVDVLFKETTTLGIRRFAVPRYILKRKVTGDKKIAYVSKRKTKIKSEFELAKRIALESEEPLSDVLI